MPGVYRLKKCPNCNVEHRKRGEFCGQSCASKFQGAKSEVNKQRISDALKEYYNTPEGIANKNIIGLRNADKSIVTIDEFVVDVPDIPELPEGYDIADKW